MLHERPRYVASSRREFLIAALAGVPLALISGCAVSRESRSQVGRNQPAVTNYGEGGNFVIREGKTLLLVLSFPVMTGKLIGDLPVRTEPESARSQLAEPQPLFFYPSEHNLISRAILSAPLDVVQGVYTASIAGLQEQAKRRWDIKYFIRSGNYQETVLNVDKSFTEPSADETAAMRRDFETIRAIVQRRTQRRWNAPFIHPVSGPDRDNFGDKRTYNDTKHSRHAGLDYQASMGTPVMAINDGIVAFSGEQLVPGNTVCIDHGGGIFSRYMHLSRLDVHEGDEVGRGVVIGLSGDSGGQKPQPHLHVAVIVNGVQVDPKDFMHTAMELLALEAQDRKKDNG